VPKRKSVGKAARADQQKPDKRILRSKLAVMAATYELLTESGLAGVSVDEVSARSGVAKTTIYRHWPSRSALLVDACSKVGSNFDLPDTGTLRGGLVKLTTEMAARLKVKKFSSAVPSVIDAAERDPEIAAVYGRVHAGFMAPLYAVLERGQERGELPRNAVPAEIVAAIAGPLFYRRWFSRERLDDRFVQGVVERALQTPKA
jgi:AcrR family transcriptional regulator